MRRESGASTGFIGRRAFAITCLASALLAGGVGACGSTAAAPTDTPAPPEPTLAAPTSMPSPTGSTMPATATSPPLMAETPRQPVTLSVYSAWAPGSVDDHYLRQLATHFKDELGYVTAITVQHSANAAEIGINIGDPPDAFAVDIGWELFMRWVTAGQMAPLDDVYEHEGLMQAFPKGVVDLASFDGHVWAVPLSVARSTSFGERHPPGGLDHIQRLGGCSQEAPGSRHYAPGLWRRTTLGKLAAVRNSPGGHARSGDVRRSVERQNRLERPGGHAGLAEFQYAAAA